MAIETLKQGVSRMSAATMTVSLVDQALGEVANLALTFLTIDAVEGHRRRMRTTRSAWA